jgi:CRISPR-associated exonuclease Cas4
MSSRLEILIPVTILVLLAILLWIVSSRMKARTGLPGGQIIYSDTRLWGAPVEKPLFDGSLGLTGKPDYLIDHGGSLIPVEVKSSRAPNAPYDSHIYQVAVYCLLVEKVYQKTPSQGLIHYPDKTFSVPFTPELRQKTLQLLSEMHAQEYHKSIPRSHEDPYKCGRCGYRDVCDQRLTNNL